MASVVINGDTSGSVTLSAPAVAGSTTLTLPTTSGTVLTSASSISGSTITGTQTIPKATLPTGSVLQVVNATNSSITTTSSETFADSGLTVSITPTSATSKVLAFVSVNGIYKAGADCALKTQLVRNSTAISYIDAMTPYTGTTGTAGGTASFNYLDSPATTSSTTYKVQIASSNTGRGVAINQYPNGLGSVSAITVMEISA